MGSCFTSTILREVRKPTVYTEWQPILAQSGDQRSRPNAMTEVILHECHTFTTGLSLLSAFPCPYTKGVTFAERKKKEDIFYQ